MCALHGVACEQRERRPFDSLWAVPLLHRVKNGLATHAIITQHVIGCCVHRDDMRSTAWELSCKFSQVVAAELILIVEAVYLLPHNLSANPNAPLKHQLFSHGRRATFLSAKKKELRELMPSDAHGIRQSG